MRGLFTAFVFVLTCSVAWALSFPDLTGRVVDAAHVLSVANVQSLDQTLADYENQSTTQIVVATISSLEGGTIEDYGYQLGRHWGIGQRDKDNGVILLVAPTEHKVRIEVGYGLEGTLTDAQSNQIIQNIILPDFRRGDIQAGITDGTRAIIETLGGKATTATLPTPLTQATQKGTPAELIVIILLLLFLVVRLFVFPSLPLLSSSPSYGSGSSGFGGSGFGGGFGGGFSGGGGSFGGGGASGGW